MSNTPKFPEVHVELVGQDGNAFSILRRVSTAMRRAGVSAEEQSAFRAEATSGDYNHLLHTVGEWVTVAAPEDDEDDDEYWYDDEYEDDEEEED